MKRYADCFFRYWHIAIAPIILLPLLSLGLLTLGSNSVDASANVWVDSVSIKELGYADSSLSPSQNMVSNLGQLLGVTSFDRLVAQRSPLYSQLAASQSHNWPVTDLRTNLSARAAGSNLVTIAYSGKNTAVATQVLQTVLRLAPTKMEQFNHRPLNSSALKIVDPPALAATTASKKSLLLRFGLIFAVAFLLSGTFIVVRTALDRSVRYPDEVPELLHLPVLGIVPYSRELSKREKAG